MRTKQCGGWWVGMAVWFSCAALLQASPWAVTPGQLDHQGYTSAVVTVDMGTTPPTAYGPFLVGQVGTNRGNLLDVAIAPDNTFALLSGFGDRILYKVDLSDPTNPTLAAKTNMAFFVEDIAISPNGKFALVSDGGFATNVAYIDLATFEVVNAGLTNGYASAVAIDRNNETILFADYFGNAIWWGKLKNPLAKNMVSTNPAGSILYSENKLLLSNSVSGLGRPINITISPDGRTALVGDCQSNIIYVFEIQTDGTVVPGVTPVIFNIHPDLSARPQSIAFSPDGQKAYTTIQTTNGNFISWIRINGPGNATLGGAGIAQVAPLGSSQFFGVDTLAVTPDGRQLVFGNATSSGTTNMLSVVDLTTFAVTLIDSRLAAPFGVAITHSAGRVLNDYDGNGQSDMTVYYSANGTWYACAADNIPTLSGVPWGYKGAAPVPGDFDGDGVSDQAVYDLKSTRWFIRSPLTQTALAYGWAWGIPGAVPTSGDFNGDGLDDPAFYNDVDGRWYARTLAGVTLINGLQWGYKGALPIPGDYDGDGINDLAVYDPQTGNWFIRSTASQASLAWAKNWGFPGSIAVPGDYNGDGVADLAVYSRYDGRWYILTLSGTPLAFGRQWGFAGATPVSGDFDGDGLSDLAVYDPGTGKWYIQSMNGAVLSFGKTWGFKGAVTVLP